MSFRLGVAFPLTARDVISWSKVGRRRPNLEREELRDHGAFIAGETVVVDAEKPCSSRAAMETNVTSDAGVTLHDSDSESRLWLRSGQRRVCPPIHARVSRAPTQPSRRLGSARAHPIGLCVSQ
ncbi:hypothetical protein FA13DRAFT_760428 [Coprinellus micaceus]|uniref:Uncharacterized protein n=1 Tax=Coprinellus micaceus TaxID=71717 RepID=A0A4Y7T3S9_COPMI|nr:hypothetical protein FA13DRAFT_760428 [Coprinellus micaceus]